MESKGVFLRGSNEIPRVSGFPQKRERRFVLSSKDVCCCSLRGVFMSLKLAVGCEKRLTLKVAVSSNYETLLTSSSSTYLGDAGAVAATFLPRVWAN